MHEKYIEDILFDCWVAENRCLVLNISDDKKDSVRFVITIFDQYYIFLILLKCLFFYNWYYFEEKVPKNLVD